MFDSKRVEELKVELSGKQIQIDTMVCSINDLEKKLQYAKDEVKEVEFKLKCREREISLQVEEAKNTLRKEMEKSLVESDLLRTEAVATLKAYEKIDTKSEREHIVKMLEKCIENFPKMKSDVVVNNK